jgi:hypothetical protein
LRTITRLSVIAIPIIAGLLIAGPVFADNMPIVHGIPTVPLTAVRPLADGLEIILDAAPPASTQFYFDVPVADASTVGVLEVWPLAEDPKHDDPKYKERCTSFPYERRQSYRLGMSTTKEGDSSYFLRATVPPLQVGQPFCFSVTARLAPSAAEMSAIGAKIGQKILGAVPDGNGQCTIAAATFIALLAQELSLDARDPRASAAIGQLARAGQSLEAAFVSTVQGPCLDYRTSKVKFDAAQAALTPGGAGSDARAAAARDAQTAVNTKLQAFKAAIPGMFTDAVRASIVVSMMDIELSAVAGQGTTPPAASFGSIDAGVFVSLPSGGSQSSPDIWLVPYLGLNLYTTPVDRTVDLKQLTGSSWDRVRQRVSLTIGVTLSAPSLAGRTLSAPLLARYPVIALGVRTSSYSRITAGAVLYDIASANPASAAHSLAAAPFVGAALDIDLIHLLTQAKL